MNDFTAARKRLYLCAKELHELADDIDAESGELLVVRVGVGLAEWDATDPRDPRFVEAQAVLKEARS